MAAIGSTQAAFGEDSTTTISNRNRLPRVFIVHGHDELVRRQTKDFLQNRLGFPEPIILDEQPDAGRTVIEKFEHFAQEADCAVVLLTPDDNYVTEGTDAVLWRARQNVILELGYFLGKWGRLSGRVLVLYKPPLDIPSDIRGVIYINIGAGIEVVGERIRRELTVE